MRLNRRRRRLADYKLKWISLKEEYPPPSSLIDSCLVLLTDGDYIWSAIYKTNFGKYFKFCSMLNGISGVSLSVQNENHCGEPTHWHPIAELP